MDQPSAQPGALLMSAHAKSRQRQRRLCQKWLLGVCDLDHSFGSQRARKKLIMIALGSIDTNGPTARPHAAGAIPGKAGGGFPSAIA
jgi:hypothetical protein